MGGGVTARFTVLALLALLGSSAAVSAQQPVPGYDVGLFQLVSRGLAPRVLLPLTDSTGRVLLPVHPLLEATGLSSPEAAGRLTVPRMNGGHAVLDLARRQLIVGADTVPLSPRDLVVTAAEAYLAPAPLGQLLEAQVRVDLGSLEVSLTRESLFPAEQTEAIRRRREVLLAQRRQQEAEERAAATPFHPATGGGVLDWGVASTGLGQTATTSISTRAGGAVWGGALSASSEVSMSRQGPPSFHDQSLAYQRVFPRGSWIRQATVGDLFTSGVLSRPIRGIELTNRPDQYTPEIAEALVHPELPAGWQYEIFQAGTLIGFSDQAAAAPVPIVFRSGAVAPVYVRMYGPAGQEITRELIYHAPLSQLSPGRVEYTVGGGRCQAASCSFLRYADVRRGASRGLTVGTGGEWLSLHDSSRVSPTAEISFTTGQALTGEIFALGNRLLRGSLAVYDADRTSGLLSAEIAQPGYADLEALPVSGRQWTLSSVLTRALSRRAWSWLQGLRLEGTASGGGGMSRWSASLGAVHTGGYSRVIVENGAGAQGLTSLATTVALPGQRLLTPALDAQVAGNSTGLQIISAALSVRPGRAATATAGVRWTRAHGNPQLTLGFNGYLAGIAQVITRATSSRYATASTFLSVSGGIGVDGRLHVDAAPAGRLGYGGIRGRVFRDVDGSGTFTPGDEPVPDVDVIVGPNRLRSDADGYFRTWGLRPYEVAPVGLDTLRSPDPSWTNESGARAVRPTPNIAVRADIPLLETREIAGALLATEGVATAAGVTVQLRNDSTAALLSTISFTDGTFYFSRVPPGSWTLSVASSSLEALHAKPTPAGLPVVVPVRGGETLLQLPPLRLVPITP